MEFEDRAMLRHPLEYDRSTPDLAESFAFLKLLQKLQIK